MLAITIHMWFGLELMSLSSGEWPYLPLLLLGSKRVSIAKQAGRTPKLTHSLIAAEAMCHTGRTHIPILSSR